MQKRFEKVVCPHCGYKMPIFFGPKAVSYDVWVRCKGRRCGQMFQILKVAK